MLPDKSVSVGRVQAQLPENWTRDQSTGGWKMRILYMRWSPMQDNLQFRDDLPNPTESSTSLPNEVT